MSEAFDGKTLLKITNKINNFKSLIRKTSDNNDEQTIDDLLNIINKNTELTDFIESEPLNKSYIGYKTIILKKIQDSECLKLQILQKLLTSKLWVKTSSTIFFNNLYLKIIQSYI